MRWPALVHTEPTCLLLALRNIQFASFLRVAPFILSLMGQQQPIRKRPGGASGGPSAPFAPQIPDKLYFRIGEVSKLCGVPSYVLRFWESEFPQLKPNKGGTGQRLYRRRDVEMALRIKSLLYDEGYTIPGARHAFKVELRAGKDPQLGLGGISEPEGTVAPHHLTALRKELADLHALLSRPAVPKGAVQSIRRSSSHTRLERREPLPAPHPFPKPKSLATSQIDPLSTLFDTLTDEQ